MQAVSACRSARGQRPPGIAGLAICGLLACIPTPPAVAERLPVDRFTQADGLAGDHVTDLHEDRIGFLWIATGSGLSRFDGQRFATYDTRHGLPHPLVRRVLESSQGHLWVATSGGLARLDPHAAAPEAQFEVWRFGSDDDNVVRELFEDSSGRLWIGAGDQVLEVVVEADSVRFEPLPFQVEPLLRPASVLAMAEGPDASLWIAMPQMVVRALSDGRQLAYPMGTNRLAFDAAGTLWGVHPNEGIFALRPEIDTAAPAIDWDERLAAAKSTPEADCRAREAGDACFYRFPDPLPVAWPLDLLPDGADLWISGDTGLAVFDDDGFRLVRTDPESHERRVNVLLRDSEGSLWLGSDSQGVLRLAAGGMATFREADGLRGRYVAQVIETPASELAAVTWRAGEYWMNLLSNGRFEPLRPRGLEAVWNGWAWNQWVVRDHRGEWWIPAEEDGLYRYPAVERVEQLAMTAPIARYTVDDGLPGIRFFRAYEDRAGDLWLGILGPAMSPVVWERARDEFRQLGAAEGLPDGIPTTPTAFGEDAEGRLWMGFYAGGVARSIDSGNRRFEYFGVAEGVPASLVNTLFFDSRGRLWIGAHSAVLRVDEPAAARPRFDRLTRAHGLSAEGACCVTEDRLGSIYLGGNRGIDRLDPEGGDPRQLTAADGLSSHLVRTVYRTRDGDLWFGTLDGLSRLSPGQERPSRPPPVRIDQVQVAGDSRPVPELGGTALSGLRLKPQEDRLTIGYFGIGMKPGEVLRYQYRLRGLNDAWSPPSTESSVTFMALPPGRHIFEVRAVRDDGTVSVVPATLSFRHLPPIWQRWWFVVAVLAMVMATGTWLHRLRVTRVLALERLRGQIAGDLHDDVGSGLSEIAILAEVARGQEPPEADATLNRVAALARLLREALGDTVWAVDPRRDQAAALLQRLRDAAYNLLETKGTAVDFVTADEERLERVRLPPDRRRDLLLLFKELIHNVSRHAEASQVDVRLELCDGDLLLEVRDNGRGFDPAHGSSGHGLDSVRTRAERLGARLSIDTARGTGCAVRLVVPLRF